MNVVSRSTIKKRFSTFWARQGPVLAALAIRSQTGEPRRNPPSRYTGQWAIRGTIYRAVGAEHFSHCGLGNHIPLESWLLSVRGRGKNRPGKTGRAAIRPELSVETGPISLTVGAGCTFHYHIHYTISPPNTARQVLLFQRPAYGKTCH